jgi:HEAT repeat protein
LSDESVEAIEHIGTNSIPYLLKALDYEGLPTWQEILAYGFDITYFKRLQDRKSQVPWAAVAAFGVLGTQASPAIPELAGMMATNPAAAQFAASALGEIGDKAIPVLLDCLTNSQAHAPSATNNLELAWECLGESATSTVPVLLDYVQDNDAQLADTCAQILATLLDGETGTETIIPALCTNLASPKPAVRRRAVDALGQYDNAGPRVLQLLRQALHDPDADVRRAAQEAVANLKDSHPPMTNPNSSDKISDAVH